MIEIDNLAQVYDGLDAWVDACDELAEGAFRGIVVDAFKYILAGTPEWSGNLVANWRLTVGQPALGYDETAWKNRSFGTGIDPAPFDRLNPNQEAIAYARAIARESLEFIRLGADVYITNNAPYAAMVEADVNEKGASFLRPVNLPVEMVMAAAQRANVLGELSEARARKLGEEAL